LFYLNFDNQIFLILSQNQITQINQLTRQP
jgi:hypothetical protein